MPRGIPLTVLGIDLAGPSRRPTGMCVLQGLKSRPQIVYSDPEVLDQVEKLQPEIVPIDAPRSLPPDRKTIHDRSGEHLRESDRELLRRRIRFFPITLGPMRMLTERGLVLKESIEGMGYRAVECFPGGAQDVWGIPRKHHDLEGLRTGLTQMGVKGVTDDMTNDELDAVTAALVGRWYLQGRGEILGGVEGIVMPIGRRTRRGVEQSG